MLKGWSNFFNFKEEIYLRKATQPYDYAYAE